ncbi:MAG: hypothetical protein F4Z02_16410 [Acidimicrobiia bacterium]|nr:hypothetical protein [Acidimicrobiia bacterium]MYG73643.1 hypothetical protein [Acidimicrobiia bacterium]
MTRDLPPDWEWATLGEIGHYQNGRAFKKDDWKETGRPIIRIQNLTGSGNSHNRFQGEVDDKHLVRDGDLLVSWAATLGVYVWRGEEAVLNQHIFKVDSRICMAFHRWLLQHVIDDLYGQAHGSGMVHITKGKFESTPVPIPPLEEQSRIVAAIEEHFSRLDAVESTQRQIIRKIDILKSSLLADAFRMNGDLPPGWQQKTIGEVAQVQLGRQRSPQHHSGPQMRPYLRSANVTWEGISLDDVKQMNFDDADFETYRLEPGDLLLNEASGSPGEVGKPAIWDGEIESCCFQNTLLRIRTAEIDIKYLYWYCFASALSGRFGDAGRGVNIRHLGKRGLSQFSIPIAPSEEQGEIAVRLDQQFEQAKRLKQTAQLVLGRVTALRRAVLAQAFSGRFVPQDPNDEPASALLERIADSR